MVAVTRSQLQELDPPQPFYNTGDTSSFAYKSALERWPVIITQIIDDVYKTVNTLQSPQNKDQIKEGQQIIEAIAKIKYEETHDRALDPLTEDGGADIEDYNTELALLDQPTWFNVPWLYSECYLYRKIRILFTTSNHWQQHDPFFRAKDETFRSSGIAVEELAVRYAKLADDLHAHPYKSMSKEAQKLLFMEMSQIALWGNATDLSLLTSLSYDDLQKLQGAEAIKASQKNVLVNDLDQVWALLGTLQGGRIDIVLDNAGFELFADLMLTMYLLDTGIAKQVVLHPKDFAWFVSDVTPPDIDHLFASLADAESYFPNAKNKQVLQTLTRRWTQNYKDGKIQVHPDPFWTTAHPFTRLPSLAPALLETLTKADLVIFKGDLNYRKLVGDATWPATTDFQTAIGHFAKSNVRILSLRTCKADVCVGLAEGLEEQLNEKHGKLAWRTNGKFAVVSFHDGKR
ncbi:venom protein 2 [Protomyces lactucae-debilis]|uniref:Sugar phosphate phosphatase n=1 Tax=Protomyces lactucae-debilis TaxID=2754530 RepID=A0A1Y2FQM4_PROLT|nr:venom protein 2 [Protomyces lactucae-debilis]ORY86278.1 venom protein 2 [Protomyces lactucae-debilis]